ncbi:MAG: hypothetical protein QF886_13140, partial [Planctomycetota bacterium]|nr:hypothetical protein [Planctomycetota bacterium]
VIQTNDRHPSPELDIQPVGHLPLTIAVVMGAFSSCPDSCRTVLKNGDGPAPFVSRARRVNAQLKVSRARKQRLP